MASRMYELPYGEGKRAKAPGLIFSSQGQNGLFARNTVQDMGGGYQKHS